MLDAQRQKYASTMHPGTVFARWVVFTHLFCGALAAVLLVFHERFLVAVVATLWYLISLGLVAGLKNHLQWCRVGLGVWCIVAVAASMFYLVWLVPEIVPPAPPVLSMAILPLWLSLWSLLYGAGGAVLLMSRRIERATMRGFELWPLPPR